MTWRFNGKDYQWIVTDMSAAKLIGLDISENGVVVARAYSVSIRTWQLGIARHMEGFEEPEGEDVGSSTKADAALTYIKSQPEEAVIEGVIGFVRSIKDRIRSVWQKVSGATNPDTDGFESVLEALTETVNRDRLPEPNQL